MLLSLTRICKESLGSQCYIRPTGKLRYLFRAYSGHVSINGCVKRMKPDHNIRHSLLPGTCPTPKPFIIGEVVGLQQSRGSV